MPSSRNEESVDAAPDTQLRVGGIVLRRTTLPGGRTVIDSAARGPDGALRLLIVRTGELVVAVPDGDPLRMLAGQALFTPRGRAYRGGDGGTQVLWTTVPLTALPSSVRPSGPLPLRPIDRAPLVDALARVIQRLLEDGDAAGPRDADAVGAGLINLQCAVLASLSGAGGGSSRAAALRDRAMRHIELHLADPDLRPPAIAEALGVSVRYLHLVFERRGLTIARSIRDRRLDAVEAALRDERPSPSPEELCARYAFASVATMQRHLRHRSDAAGGIAG